eukprot:311687-Alexandrium_andersonii.AAC.1
MPGSMVRSSAAGATIPSPLSRPLTSGISNGCCARALAGLPVATAGARRTCWRFPMRPCSACA